MEVLCPPLIDAAPAKLNLYLRVLGRQRNGYHLLDSLVCQLAVGDTLALTAAPAYQLTLAGPMAGRLAGTAAPDNLVSRAVLAVAKAAGVAPQVALTLTKNLPPASGIGGGSADAAAALRLACRYWQQPLTLAARLAPKLGADVPVCLQPAPQFFGGIGDQLAPAPALPRLPLVLVNPGVAVATPKVFQALAARIAAGSQHFSAPARPTALPPDLPSLVSLLASLPNDLTAAAISLAPPIAAALAALQQQGAMLARMAGSGATCFGVFASAAAAATAARTLAAACPHWWVVATENVPAT